MPIRMKLLPALLTALVLSATSVFATVTASDHPGSLPVLLGQDHVRKDLGLTASQARALDKIRSDFRRSARKLAASSTGTQAALDALISSTNGKALAVLTPQQRTRVIEIQHQLLGSTMLVSPTVQKKLDLKPWQVDAIEKIRSKGVEFVGQVNGWYQNGDITQTERLELLRDRRLAQARAMEILLSPAQRRALTAMQGKPLPKT